jgi:hypothetical protein
MSVRIVAEYAAGLRTYVPLDPSPTCRDLPPGLSQAVEKTAGVRNHPSGDPEPSEDDHRVTKQRVESGKILGVEPLDQIIIGDVKNKLFLTSGKEG